MKKSVNIRPLSNQISIIGNTIAKVAACAVLLTAGSAFADTFLWTGAFDGYTFQNTNNWSPVTVGRPSGGSADVLLFDGATNVDLVLTNGPQNSFDGSPGLFIHITGNQTNAVTFVESNSLAGGANNPRIRLNGRTGTGTNALFVEAGAGPVTFGNGGSYAFPIALANGANCVHLFTNNSAYPVTFNSDICWVMGGGNLHTNLFAGSGDWVLNGKFQATTGGGAALALVVAGTGTLTLGDAAAPNTTYGGYGNLTVYSGTLKLTQPDSIGVGNTLILNGGNLDSAVPNLINVNNNLQRWGGSFGFVGTQSLDLGFGAVTLTASPVVTVQSNTLTVGGAISGGFSLTVAGGPVSRGALILNGANTYTGGTVVSNGLLQLGNASALPTGSSSAESVAAYGSGTLDLNGNSIIISSLNGTGGSLDTLSGGTPTLTVGDFNANGSFSGSISNSAGSIALVKTGLGTLTLGGASTYSGGTTVSGGTLLVTNLTGSGTGSGSVTVSAGTAFGGTGSAGGSVNWQANSIASFTVGSTLTVSGPVTLNNNNVTIFVPGAVPLGTGSYTLMTYNNTGSSGSFSSGTPSFTGAGVLFGTSQTITTGGGQVVLTVAPSTGVVATWINDGSGNWSAGANWSSNPNYPQNPADSSLLGVGSAFTTVTLDVAVTNAAIGFTNANSFAVADAGNTMTLDNSNHGASFVVVLGTLNSIAPPLTLRDNLGISIYPGAALAISNTISSSSPSRTLSVGGTGTLALSGNNTYGPSAGTVGTILSGAGTVELDNNNALSTGDVSIQNNATLRAGTTVSVANNMSIGFGLTGTIDNQGNDATLSGAISGAGGLAKNGSGTLTLSGINTFSNGVTVNAGTLRLGNAGGIPGGVGYGNVTLGTNTLLDLNGFSPVLNGLGSSAASAVVNNLAAGAVTLTNGESGAFATYNGVIKNTGGSLALVKDGAGTQTLAGTNLYSGGTTINAGTLQVGNGNVSTSATGIAVGLGTGPVNIGGSGTLAFQMAGTNVFTNTITGSGTLTVNNITNKLFLAADNSAFTGNITVNTGSLWITNSSELGTGPKTITATAAGNSLFSRIYFAPPAGNNLSFDPSIAWVLTLRDGVLVNLSGSNTISGNISTPYGGGNTYIIVTNGFLTLAGSVSSDGIAGGRVLQLGGPGNGLFSGVMFDNVNADALQKTDSGTWTVSGDSPTIGGFTVNGGKMIFTGSLTNGAITVVTNATIPAILAGTGECTNLTVGAGANSIFVPGDFNSIGSFTVANNLNWQGRICSYVNNTGSPSSTLVTVVNTDNTNLTAAAGATLTVTNLGPALVIGDSFQLFSQPVTNGDLVTISSRPAPGLMYSNYLAVDGSVKVAASTALWSTNLNFSVVGNALTLSWPADHIGWTLQVQTNTLAVGLATNWFDVPNSTTVGTNVVTINTSAPTVFYRMMLK